MHKASLGGNLLLFIPISGDTVALCSAEQGDQIHLKIRQK